jgi:hypothetical protein
VNKKLLKDLPVFPAVNSGGKVFGFNPAANAYGFYVVDQLTQKGYAARRWSVNNSSPVGETAGSIEYLRDLPGLLGLGCYLVTNTRAFNKLNPLNHYQYADGSPAALDGSQGDYMWCWNAHYYATWQEGEWEYEAVSLTPILGRWNYYVPAGGISALGGAVIDRTNNLLVSVISNDPRYRGGDNDATRDGAFNTLIGRIATNMTVKQFSDLARAKGEGWEACWFVHYTVLSYLFRIIFGTRNVKAAFNPNKDSDGLYQRGLGNGLTMMNGTATGYLNVQFNNAPYLPTSCGTELGDACGIAKYPLIGQDGNVLSTLSVPVFFGLKNPFGYFARVECGILSNSLSDGTGDIYVAKSLYAGWDLNITDKMIQAASYPAIKDGKSSSYIRRLSMQHLCCIPTDVEATASTGYCNGFYNSPTSGAGLHVLTCNGGSASATLAGLEYRDVSSFGVGYKGIKYTSPLCVTTEDVIPIPKLYT